MTSKRRNKCVALAGCAFLQMQSLNRTTRSAWLWVWLLLMLGQVSAEQLPLKLYTTADGLAHENVLQIVRDSRGFLPFAAAGGLRFRYG